MSKKYLEQQKGMDSKSKIIMDTDKCEAPPAPFVFKTSIVTNFAEQ